MNQPFSFTYYSLAPFLISLLFLTLGTVVIKDNPRSTVNKSYVYWCITTFGWQVTWGLLLNCKNEIIALLIAKFGHSFIIFIPITYYHFIVNLLNKHQSEKRIIYASYFLGIFFLFSLWLSDNYLSGLYQYSWGFYPKAGKPLYAIYFLFLSALALRCQLLTLKELKKAAGSIRALQLKYVFFGGFAYLSGGLDYLANYGFKVFPVGVFGIIFSFLINAYAILRFRFLDFNLIMRWGSAYFLLFLTLAGSLIPLTLISEWISRHLFHFAPGLSLIFISCFVVLIFEPLRIRITRFVDKFIFQSPDYHEILKGIEIDLKGSESIENLCTRLTSSLKTIYAADHAGFLLWNYNNASYEPFPKSEFSETILIRTNEKIDASDFLIRTLESEKRLFWQGIVLEDELTVLSTRAMPGERTTFSKIKRSMRWIGAKACVPIITNDKLIAVLILGGKSGGKIFNNEDKKFLSHVSGLCSNKFQSLLN